MQKKTYCNSLNYQNNLLNVTLSNIDVTPVLQNILNYVTPESHYHSDVTSLSLSCYTITIMMSHNILIGASMAEWLRSLTSTTCPSPLWVGIPTGTLDSFM
jgi:hypothetical protein